MSTINSVRYIEVQYLLFRFNRIFVVKPLRMTHNFILFIIDSVRVFFIIIIIYRCSREMAVAELSACYCFTRPSSLFSIYRYFCVRPSPKYVMDNNIMPPVSHRSNVHNINVIYIIHPLLFLCLPLS